MRSSRPKRIRPTNVWPNIFGITNQGDLLTFLQFPGMDATNWRAELAIRFGVILRKVWGGNRTWVGARAQAILMSVWRTCWQRGFNALDFLSQLLRRTPALAQLLPSVRRASVHRGSSSRPWRLSSG